MEASKRVELLQVVGREAGGFTEVPRGRILKRFVVGQRPTREGPHVFVGFADAADQRQPQRGGRPDFSLGRRAKITVEIANDGGASRLSATFAELVFTAFTSLHRRPKRSHQSGVLVKVMLTRTNGTTRPVVSKMPCVTLSSRPLPSAAKCDLGYGCSGQ